MSENSCLYLIHSLMDSFSDKEQKVARYILNNPADSVHPSIDELAGSIGVSISTMVRFVRKLGYEGYQQFRIALATEALAPNLRFYEVPVTENEDSIKIVFGAARTALDMTEKMLDRDAIKQIAKKAVQARSCYIFGLGGSNVVARDAFHKIIRSGIRCQTAEDYHLQLMLASQAGDKDVALVISHTGANKDTLGIAEILKKQGCTMGVITTYPRSPLARSADFLLLAGAPGAAIISEAFSARIAHLAIVDVLYVEIMELLKNKGIESVQKMRSAIAGRRI